ncbi:OmpA family protein [Paraburkholderia sp. BCC1876]|uniref:OmpA family protein n=1 Tax=Paraburkholderia sp. BCC1876 TaxID=2676303 RepID=UPI001FC7E4C8|nr:OmpA family protein [Paraburkholderia sp. BCC1876]
MAPIVSPSVLKRVPLAGFGYPLRLMIIFAAMLAIADIVVLPPGRRVLTYSLSAILVLLALVAIVARTWQLDRIRAQSRSVIAALGSTTTDLPLELRLGLPSGFSLDPGTRMPLVMVLGDGLADLFNREGHEERLAYIGEGAIWLRVDRLQDLPSLVVAVQQWRNGLAPDGVVLSIAPALHATEDTLKQQLSLARQAVSDASRALGATLPGYIAMYQRLTATDASLGAASWYGVSSATRLQTTWHFETPHFETVIRAAEIGAQIEAHQAYDKARGNPIPAACAAKLASLIDWTHRVVISALADRRHPATPLSLYGVGWIDCGPASHPGTPWMRDVAVRTHIQPAPLPASSSPWPLPQPLLEALPKRPRTSPRQTALLQVVALLAVTIALAMWGAAHHNQQILTRVGTELGRFAAIASTHDDARRDALQTLIAERDRFDRYARTGVPLSLSFGMYRGAALTPVLDNAIASYQAPPPLPSVITLDSMSLFDSGTSVLKAGSTRSIVAALDLIKAHPDKRILVAGHTDNVGNPDSNQRLSVARASAVRDWLIDASGLSATRFAIQGYGETRPLTNNSTDAGRARNRRVEITLVPDISIATGT